MPIPPNILARASLNAPKNFTQNAFRNLPGNRTPVPTQVSVNAVINSFRGNQVLQPKANPVPTELPTLPTFVQTTTGFSSFAQILAKKDSQAIFTIEQPVVIPVDAIYYNGEPLTYNGEYITYHPN